MRTKILILWISFLFLFCCGMPMIQQVKLYPKPADEVYNQLILTLQELGWTIKHTDKASLVILAQIKMLDKDRFMGSDLAHPFEASFYLKEKNGQTSISITITQPGELLKNPYAERWSEKIIKSLEEKIR